MWKRAGHHNSSCTEIQMRARMHSGLSKVTQEVYNTYTEGDLVTPVRIFGSEEFGCLQVAKCFMCGKAADIAIY